MDVDGFLKDIQSSPDYEGQIVYVHESPAAAAEFGRGMEDLSPSTQRMLSGTGIEQLYSHQAEAIAAVRDGEDVLIVTGTASGKSLCYQVPLIETFSGSPAFGHDGQEEATSLLLFPTKALCQDQFKAFQAALTGAEIKDVLAGVYDGDTPAHTRRKLRDHARALFSNPDMVHAVIMPQHVRWANFLARLKYIVLDELHVYSGIFGANMASLLRRFGRLCAHYRQQAGKGPHSLPQIISCSATMGNPHEMAQQLTGRDMTVINRDGSPRGRRVYVFWNPPTQRARTYRSRRSANVEAHELMANLISRNVPTITFSKAKMTAEMIHRYVCEALQAIAPHLTKKVTPYRGGYRPEERREIERRLFSGELMGVSTTRALELGIDVGALEACIVVGYPGTLASFLQQSGRAGRGERDSLVVLIGLDTAVNQYVMSHPEYIFGRPVEQAVIDRDNPFVVLSHLRCATHEIPLEADEAGIFGPYAEIGLKVLQENHKVRQIDTRWYHAATETPQHETALRDYADKNVLIEDVDTGQVIGEVNKFDAPPIVHPEAIYMHRGDTYRVLTLDLERNIASVKREDVDYYTQPLGGTDIHHVDARLREKPFGTGRACWGEVTAYFGTNMYEKIRFYELDAISVHDLELPLYQLETMGVWMIPPEPLLEEVRLAGLDVHAGLRGIGYGTRILLPLFITCDTLDFSHTIGSVNSPWQSIFIYERFRLGLGYTRKAYEMLDVIMPAVLDNIRNCPCEDGCPCCVGKPLRQYAVWNVERGEASIPSKQAALMILEGYLADCDNLTAPDDYALSDDATAEAIRLEQALRRRLERGREPEIFHAIEPSIETGYPEIEKADVLDTADVTARGERRVDHEKDLRKRLAKKLGLAGLHPTEAAAQQPSPPGMSEGRGNLPPGAFPGRPEGPQIPAAQQGGDEQTQPVEAEAEQPPAIQLGDSLAAKALRLKRKRKDAT
ncbi:MAG: DEAD/DEAH box helicase [Planctomycetota bacterium]|jgi:DEAD/DEAH box helicase domain-containing protein